MLWLVLACVVLGMVFLRSLVLPMFLGFAVGALIYFAEPMLQFESDLMLVMVCGMAGLALGVIRSVIWLPAAPKKS